jgi:thiamine-monophosphate kinase
MTTEDDVIGCIRESFGALVAPGAWGFADDAALMPPVPEGRTRVVTTDVVVEGVDFDRTLYPLVYAGARALAQNLSDVGAMGASPVGFLWSLAVPRASLGADLEEFVRGAAALAKTRRVPLFGGDLSSTAGPLVCSITAFGDVEGFPIRRSGARLGDDVCLTSPVGASTAGLRRLKRGDAPAADVARFGQWMRALPELEARAVRAHLRPLPPDGTVLAGRATSCIDISDGLARDAHRLAAASGIALDLDQLPAAVDPAATLEDAIGGGEDYALLFTVPHGASPALECLRIGRVVEGEGVWHAGRRVASTGFDHFG